MKRIHVIASALLVFGVFACEKKHEDRPGETSTTSGTTERSGDRPVEQGVSGGTTTTGGATDVGNTQGGGADIGTTTTTSDDSFAKGGKDAGVQRDFGSNKNGPVGVDRNSGTPSTGTTTPRDPNNTSTTLGNGKSGTYTGGQGTYGGKATHGTGTSKPNEPGMK